MKLFLACMIRNEIDILPEFLGHIDSLFDGGCLVDHLSSDGSEILMRDFTATREGWNYLSIKTPSYLQAEISTELLKRGFGEGADAIFFLDADEFVAGLGRAALKQTVEKLEARKCVGLLRWRNCLPDEYRGTFSLGHKAWLCGLAPHRKLVVPHWLYTRYGDKLGVNQGNHSLRVPDGASFPALEIGKLLHFPIRSREQLIRKIFVSYASQAARPGKVIAPHIQALFDTLLRHDLTPGMLNALAVNYGAPTVREREVEIIDLEKLGYALKVPEVSRNRLDLNMPAHNGAIDFGDISYYL